MKDRLLKQTTNKTPQRKSKMSCKA